MSERPDRRPSKPRAVNLPWARRRAGRVVDDELRFHLEGRIEELVHEGYSREAAEAEAMRRFGDVGKIRDEVRRVDQRTFGRRSFGERFASLWRDVRFAWRAIWRRPIFAAVVVATLTLAIGGNGAVFAALNGVLFRPFDVPELDRLVVVRDDLPALGLREIEVSPSEAEDLGAEHELFENAAGWVSSDLNLEGTDEPQRVAAAATIGPFFDVFRVRPFVGRLYGPPEGEEGRAPVVLLGYAFWRDHFGADPRVIGRSIVLNGTSREVVGVLPPTFRLPRTAQLWLPFRMTERVRSPEQRMSLYAMSVARLRPGVTLDEVRARLPRVTAKWRPRFPDSYGTAPADGPRLVARPFIEFEAGALRPALLVLFGAVGLVLLIACANVASLQLVRSAERGRELAVRASMGAGRGAILQQLLVEQLLFGVCGGMVGLGLAVALLRAVRLVNAPELEALRDVNPSGSMLAFTLAVTMLSVVAFGMLPAMRASRVNVRDALNDASRGTTAGVARHRLLAGSVVAQIALALVLLLGGALTLRSLEGLLAVDPGFRPSSVMTLSVSLPGARYGSGEARTAFFDALLEKAQAIPGVSAAGLVSELPFSGRTNSSPFRIAGKDALPGEPEQHANMRVIGGDYFRAIGIPVLRGRTFASSDRPPAPTTLVVDDVLARQFFSGRSPLGQIVSQGPEGTVIGVVGSVKHSQLGEPLKATIYHSQHDASWLNSFTLVVRSNLPPSVLTPQLRSAVRALDPALPVYDVMPMAERIDRSLSVRRLSSVVLTAFAAVAVLLAVLGVWGVIGYRMAHRTTEIGIRLALGARPHDVTRMVLAEGLLLAAAGVAAGIPLYFALSRFMSALLYGISPRDPLTTSAVALSLAVVALVASWFPARRAAKVDPLVAMRG